MKRRIVLGLAASAIGGSLAVGSGAFTAAEAERSVTVEVADDAEGFLVIDAEAVDTAGRSSLVSLDPDIDDPYQASFRIPGPEEGLIGETDPDGIGKDSRYKFDSMAVIRNQGTQAINVFSGHDGALDDIAIFDVENPETLLTSPEKAITLETGEEFTMGLYLETGNQDLGEYDETVTIIGEGT